MLGVSKPQLVGWLKLSEMQQRTDRRYREHCEKVVERDFESQGLRLFPANDTPREDRHALDAGVPAFTDLALYHLKR